MKTLGSRFALIAIVTLAGLIAIYPPDQRLKAGIDLSGGTILVYQVKQEGLPRNFKMDDLIGTLKKRINPEGVVDIPIRKVGDYRVEIILPKASAEDVDEVKKKMTEVGSLNFRILANRKHDGPAIDRALAANGFRNPPNKYQWAQLGESFSGRNPRFDASSITDLRQNWSKGKYVGRSVALTGKDAAGGEKTVVGVIKENGPKSLTFTKDHGLSKIESYSFEFNPSGIVASSDAIVREEKSGTGRTDKYILVKLDRHNVTGDELTAREAQDEKWQPAVGFEFDHKGARRFAKLTGEFKPEEDGAFQYRLAIILDNVVRSAPAIRSEIRDGKGIIEGGFTTEEVARLVAVLRAGSLPATLNPVPIQEEKVGPTLGDDTIRKGINAIMISMLVVPIFMMVYYRFAGVVAVVALILNMILLVGSMAIINASFTLPGLAGLALTIGMAVDANVLIFERMREEKERGAGMVQQIRNGFTRAWTTIFDANVCTMLSALVLYGIGTEEVKGFAITLIIGLIWNFFTAVFVSRVIFDFWYKKGWLRKLTMMKILDKTNIDFIGPRYYCIAGSIVVTIAGLALFVFRARENTMFNIDFTGGTLVTIRLNGDAAELAKLSTGQRTELVRKKAMTALPDVTVESLNVGADKAAGVRFNIRTTELDPNKVRASVLKEYGGLLAQVEMKPGSLNPIPKAVAAEKSGSPNDASAVESAATFPGGVKSELTFNSAQPPSGVSRILREILVSEGIANPESRFEIIDPNAPPGATTDTPPRQSPYALELRTDIDRKQVSAALEKLAANLRENPDLLFERLTNFSGIIAGETRTLALIATLASWLIIIVYLWFRFKSLTFGLAAVVAVVHDVLVALGAVAASYWLAQVPGLREALMLDQFKIDLPMIAAFLTLIGFSVNDTIVIFDRIRELKGKSPNLTGKLINDAVNQTLSRTILTTLTAWTVVIILFIFGGEGLHGFAFTLVVGFLSGTYSTIYIASPILIDFAAREKTPAKNRQTAAAAAAR